MCHKCEYLDDIREGNLFRFDFCLMLTYHVKCWTELHEDLSVCLCETNESIKPRILYIIIKKDTHNRSIARKKIEFKQYYKTYRLSISTFSFFSTESERVDFRLYVIWLYLASTQQPPSYPDKQIKKSIRTIFRRSSFVYCVICDGSDSRSILKLPYALYKHAPSLLPYLSLSILHLLSLIQCSTNAVTRALLAPQTKKVHETFAGIHSFRSRCDYT